MTHSIYVFDYGLGGNVRHMRDGWNDNAGSRRASSMNFFMYNSGLLSVNDAALDAKLSTLISCVQFPEGPQPEKATRSDIWRHEYMAVDMTQLREKNENLANEFHETATRYGHYHGDIEKLEDVANMGVWRHPDLKAA